MTQGNASDRMQSEGNTSGSGERRKKYPIRCVECGKREVRRATANEKVRRNHDGRVYELAIDALPVTKCNACGSVFFTQESDERITASLRQHLALLTPEQIGKNLEVLGLSQKEAAQRLGIAPETLSRWICSVVIQSRAMDNLLRVFFACVEVREKLTGAEQDRSFGEAVMVPAGRGALPSRNTTGDTARYRMLQKHGLASISETLAQRIRERGSVFAPAA